MGNEEWEMRNRKCGMGNEEWEMENQEWGMRNGKMKWKMKFSLFLF